jgi:hypothetical protein
MLRGLLCRCERCRSRVPRGPWDSWTRTWRTAQYCPACRAEIDAEMREREEQVRARVAAWLARAPAYHPDCLARDRKRSKYKGNYFHRDPWVQELDAQQALDTLTKLSLRKSLDNDTWPGDFPKIYLLVHGWVEFNDAELQRVPRYDAAPGAMVTFSLPPQRHRDSLLLSWHNEDGSHSSLSRYIYYYDRASVYARDGKIYLVWVPIGSKDAGYS